MARVDESALARRLAQLSADEIVAALRIGEAHPALRGATRAAFFAVSAPLGRALARFDARIAAHGPSRAAADALTDFGASWTREGAQPPAQGALVVVANHPGAYDAMTLLAAAGRDDVAILAADRGFLRALPSLEPHLIFVPEPPASALARTRALRRALDHLSRGGALLHFGAGRIEPDPAFPLRPGDERLAPWQRGAGALVRGAARAGGQVVLAIVAGVHSRRAKAHFVNRMAERRGVTTLAPLLQMSFRRYREVNARVRFGAPQSAGEVARMGDDAAIAAALRSSAEALLPAP